MAKFIGVYGILAGLILAGSLLVGYLLGAEMDDHSVLLGYTIMLLALSFVFIGVKRYRDQVLGGVIRFPHAFGVGMGIAAVASLFYVFGWEAYMAATDFTFMDAYVESSIAARAADGASPAELAAMRTEMAAFAEQYRNPLFRMAVTFAEILPVGLLVALVAAALLRNRNFLPVRAAR